MDLAGSNDGPGFGAAPRLRQAGKISPDLTNDLINEGRLKR